MRGGEEGRYLGRKNETEGDARGGATRLCFGRPGSTKRLRDLASVEVCITPAGLCSIWNGVGSGEIHGHFACIL